MRKLNYRVIKMAFYINHNANSEERAKNEKGANIYFYILRARH